MKKIYAIAVTIILFQQLKAQDTVSCAVTFDDTLKYVMSKINFNLTQDSLISMKNTNAGTYGYSSYGQAFEAPEPVKVKGVSFYGIIYSGPADSVWVKLYNMNSSLPDTVIDSVYVPLSYQPGFSGYDYYYNTQNIAIFPNQPVVTSDYMIAVENHSSRDYYVLRTKAGNGNSEGIAYTYYEGVTDPTYDGWYNILSFGPDWDFDFVFEPMIEYQGNAQLVINSDSLCDGDTLVVEMTVAMNDTAIFYNKFYSQDYAAYADSFAVDLAVNYGDGSGFTSNLNHSYSTGGNHTLQFQLTGAYPFWSLPQDVLSCTYDVYQSYLMGQIAVEDTLCLNETVVLYPGDFDSYQWNTGQLTDSIQVGTFIQPDSLIYFVNVSDGSCQGTYTYPIFVDNCLGIEENEIDFDVYPNPTTNEFIISSDQLVGKELSLFNMLGENVFTTKGFSSMQTIDVSELPVGFYTLRISGNEINVIKKIQIVK